MSIRESITSIYYFFVDHINFVYTKVALYMLPIALLIYSFFKDLYSPIWPLLGYLFIFGVIDLITGLWASLKEKIPITSRRFWFGKAAVVTLFLFGMTCMLLMDKMLKEVHESVPNVCFLGWMLFYAAYECVSILENISRLGYLPGVPVIIAKLKSILPSWVTDGIEKTKEEEEKKEDPK